MEDDRRELQLLPTPPTPPHTRGHYSHPSDSIRYQSDNIQFPLESTSPSLDLQLSISNLRPNQPPADHRTPMESFDFRSSSKTESERFEALKSQSADEAYAGHVKEMTKREMELAQSEFSRAKHVWERAVEEVERVEKMKQRAIRRIDSSCIEITCQACRKTFRR